MIISSVISLVIAIIIFGAVVLVHEWGHFIAARRSGIFVEEFAIGMGPKLLATRGGDKKTVYSLRAIPIGGFCKMMGEDAECPDERAFNNKKISRRVLVMLAGALMNFVLAFVIFLTVVIIEGYPMPLINRVMDNSPAMAAGLQSGDRIKAINGTGVNLYEDILFALYSSGGKPLEVRFLRDGVAHTATITPFADEYGDFKIGFYPDYKLGLFGEKADGYRTIGVFDSVQTAFYRIAYYIKVTVVGVIRLVTLRASVNEMAGPIGIVNMIDETYKATIDYSVLSTVITMLKLCALLSANLGVINLLPLPALDGGRLVFLALEGIRRKPIPPEREGMVHFVGFVLLMVLAAFIAFQDIMKML